MTGDAADQPSTEPRRGLRSEELLQGRDEVEVIHDGHVYRLRRTRSGKLILTK